MRWPTKVASALGVSYFIECQPKGRSFISYSMRQNMLALMVMVFVSALGANGLISSRLTHRVGSGISTIDEADNYVLFPLLWCSRGSHVTNSALYAKKKMKKQTLDSCPPGCKVFFGQCAVSYYRAGNCGNGRRHIGY